MKKIWWFLLGGLVIVWIIYMIYQGDTIYIPSYAEAFRTIKGS